VNAIDRKGDTPLCCAGAPAAVASASGYSRSVTDIKLLLEAGACCTGPRPADQGFRHGRFRNNLRLGIGVQAGGAWLHCRLLNPHANIGKGPCGGSTGSSRLFGRTPPLVQTRWILTYFKYLINTELNI